MKRILNRLRSKRGETLVEVMASILIFTLSSILLYSMITTANRINAEVRDTEQAQQENLMFAQKAEGDGEAGTISLSLTRPEERSMMFSAISPCVSSGNPPTVHSIRFLPMKRSEGCT